MTLNWGWRIAIGYSLFAAMILYLVVVASQQTNDLVSEDYYAQTLSYQERIDARSNSQALAEPLRFVRSEDRSTLLVQFPSGLQEVSGQLHFYRPSDASQDRVVDLSGSGGQAASLDVSQMEAGFWRLQLDWESGGRAYFDETTLMLP